MFKISDELSLNGSEISIAPSQNIYPGANLETIDENPVRHNLRSLNYDTSKKDDRFSKRPSSTGNTSNKSRNK
jgi:hypothetical protein